MEKFKKFINSFYQSKREFRCVNCGSPVKELYKTYSPTIQKLSGELYLNLNNLFKNFFSECEKCFKTADEFVEFDNLYIVINLVLLSSQAQRHVLYNTRCKNLYKILMIITLLESFCLFRESVDKFGKSNDILYLEKGYYLSTLQVILCKLVDLILNGYFNNSILANLTFFTIIRIVSSWSELNQNRGLSLTADLFRGFMLASIAKFFFLPIVIWRENISGWNAGVHLVLVIGYFVISLIYVHSTITQQSKKKSAATIFLAFVCNKYIWANMK